MIKCNCRPRLSLFGDVHKVNCTCNYMRLSGFYSSDEVCWSSLNQFVRSQCWSHRSRLITRISRRICKFNNTCNYMRLSGFYLSDAVCRSSLNQFVRSQCWSHRSRLITRISRQICKFSNIWNWTGLEQLETPHNFLDTPNKVIVQSGDVQKAGVLGGIRLDPKRPQDQEIPRVPLAIWKSRLISFIHF